MMDEKESLKVQVQQYILEVRRIEDVLNAKEQERSDLLSLFLFFFGLKSRSTYTGETSINLEGGIYFNVLSKWVGK